MGLAASQARLLFITGRKNDVEFNQMRIANEKISLSRDSAELADEYTRSLNQRKLMWAVDGSATSSNTVDLTYDLLMQSGTANQVGQYLITDSNDRVALSDDICTKLGLSGSGRSLSMCRSDFVARMMGDPDGNGVTESSTVKDPSGNMVPYGADALFVENNFPDVVTGKTSPKSTASASSNIDEAMATIQMMTAGRVTTLPEAEGTSDDDIQTYSVDQVTKLLTNLKAVTDNAKQIIMNQTGIQDPNKVDGDYAGLLTNERLKAQGANGSDLSSASVVAAMALYNNAITASKYLILSTVKDGVAGAKDSACAAGIAAFNITINGGNVLDQFNNEANDAHHYYPNEAMDLLNGLDPAAGSGISNRTLAQNALAAATGGGSTVIQKVLGKEDAKDSDNHKLKNDGDPNMALRTFDAGSENEHFFSPVDKVNYDKILANHPGATSIGQVDKNGGLLVLKTGVGCYGSTEAGLSLDSDLVNDHGLVNSGYTSNNDFSSNTDSTYFLVIKGVAADKNVGPNSNYDSNLGSLNTQLQSSVAKLPYVDDDKKSEADFYTEMYYAIQSKGWKQYSSVENKDWLQNQLISGNFGIEKLDRPGKFLDLPSSDPSSPVRNVRDTEGVADAESKYQAEKDKMDTKESLLDIQMKNLDTERSELDTEVDSVKSIITKNIERSFKMFA